MQCLVSELLFARCTLSFGVSLQQTWLHYHSHYDALSQLCYLLQSKP